MIKYFLTNQFYITFMQTTNPDQMSFHEQTDAFDLTLNLNQNKLTVTLKDFVDWAIYEKKYTDDDIGGDINRRMDLFDVYSVFSQTKFCCDEVEMKEKQGGISQIRQYQFGSIIENEGVPCYKIERRGIITVYWVITQKKIKKQMTYESKLLLEKVRSMTEMEIFTEKSSIQKRSIFEQLKKQLQKQKREKEDLLARVIALEEENLRLKQESNSKKQQLQRTKEELKQLISTIKQEQSTSIQSTKTELAASVTSAKVQLDTKINQVNQQLSQKIQVQTQRSSGKFAQLQQILKSIRISQRYLSLTQANGTYFKVDGVKIQYIGPNGWTHFILNDPIQANQNCKIKIKILQTHNKEIMLGVLDYAKQKDQRLSYSSGNAMCYYGYNGYKYPGGGSEGEGFKQGDIVEADVNRANNTIKYSVNETLRATQTNQILGDSSRIFMPFIDMYRNNDIVELQTEIN